MTPSTASYLGDRYSLQEILATGGMGDVWRGTDEVLGRPVAIKVLRPNLVGEASFLERFRAEARHAARLSHTGIAHVHDYGEDEGAFSRTCYLVMELVPGEPLSALLRRDGFLDVERALAITGQAAHALHAAHAAGVVHRDVKPGNVLVTPDLRVKITDFGIARAADSLPLTQTGVVMGTPHYLSPEQASGQSVTPASDIYALGVVAYECLTGRRPFLVRNPVAVARAHLTEDPPPLPEHLPSPVRSLVLQALSKRPQDRPPSGQVFGDRLLALRQELVGGDRPAPHAASQGARAPAPALSGSGRTDPPTLGAPLPAPFVGAPPRRPAALVLAVVGVVAAVLATGAFLSRGDPVRSASGGARGQGGAPQAHQARPQRAQPDRRVQLSARPYVGKPYPNVRAALADRGLTIARATTKGSGRPGTVAFIAPTGRLERGTTVTVTVVKQPPSGRHHGHQPDKGKGRQ
ncbi:MAG: protein kinase domain-containing protein [Carbonactinosporaceae bacterium]